MRTRGLLGRLIRAFILFIAGLVAFAVGCVFHVGGPYWKMWLCYCVAIVLGIASLTALLDFGRDAK